MMEEGKASGFPNEFIRRGLRLAHLRLLVALQDTGQISGAASRVAVTQPAASRLMAELEQIAGTGLYSRHSKGVLLTVAGQLLAEKASIVLRQLDDAHSEITGISRGMRGHVHIGAVTGPALELVLPALRELRVTFPQIEISIDVETSDKLIESLLARKMDFYIGRLPPGVDARAVRMRLIGPEPVSFIARTGHPLNKRGRIDVAQCLPFDWVMQPPGGLMRRAVETYLLENGYELPVRILGTASMLLTLAIISDTNAVAPVSTSVGEFYSRRNALGSNIRMLTITNPIAVSPYSVVVPAQRMLSPAAETVLAILEQKIQQAEAARLYSHPTAGTGD
ncbi:LysR family transcriptional regulator [Aureimonas fodinaquatilis]|nr:LysR family transcriptional regulator [Aureimonas fodinaquatilis]